MNPFSGCIAISAGIESMLSNGIPSKKYCECRLICYQKPHLPKLHIALEFFRLNHQVDLSSWVELLAVEVAVWHFLLFVAKF